MHQINNHLPIAAAPEYSDYPPFYDSGTIRHKLSAVLITVRPNAVIIGFSRLDGPVRIAVGRFFRCLLRLDQFVFAALFLAVDLKPIGLERLFPGNLHLPFQSDASLHELFAVIQ